MAQCSPIEPGFLRADHVAQGESDAELVEQIRSGRLASFEKLYDRHCLAARHVAAAQADNAADVDDVVADAFAYILHSLAAGKGPDTFFRGYLLTAVRRIAHKHNQAATRASVTGDDFVLDSKHVDADPVIADFESSAIAGAFATLPTRWQEVLWYVDIEGMKPAAASPLLGVTPNAISSLVLRARERLRQAYLQNHVGSAVGEVCEEYSNQLGAYARNGLGSRSAGKIREHLDNCSKCTALLVDLNDMQSAMRAVLFPMVAGIAFTGAIPALSAGVGGTAISAVGSHSAHGALPLLLKMGTGVLAASVVAVGAAVAMGGTGAPTADVPVAEASLVPGPTIVPSQTTAPAEQSPMVPAAEETVRRQEQLPPTVPALVMPSSPRLVSPGPILSARQTSQAWGSSPVASVPPLFPGFAGPVDPIPTTLPTVLPTPGATPTVAGTPSPTPQVAASFRVDPGTSAAELNIVVIFSLREETAPATAEAVFTISGGAQMIPGKLIEPAGWTCRTDNTVIDQFRCTSDNVDPDRLVFSMGVYKSDSSRTRTMDYTFSGGGMETARFSNDF